MVEIRQHGEAFEVIGPGGYYEVFDGKLRALLAAVGYASRRACILLRDVHILVPRDWGSTIVVTLAQAQAVAQREAASAA